MARPSFHAAVSALADSIVRELSAAGQPNTAQPAAMSVARFLLDQHARMPDYLRFPFKGLVLAFDAWPLVSTGRCFHDLPHDQRLRQIRAWKESRLGVRRNLIRFFESLATFSWYSETYGQAL